MKEFECKLLSELEKIAKNLEKLTGAVGDASVDIIELREQIALSGRGNE